MIPISTRWPTVQLTDLLTYSNIPENCLFMHKTCMKSALNTSRLEAKPISQFVNEGIYGVMTLFVSPDDNR